MEASHPPCASSAGWKVEGAELPPGCAISLNCSAGTYPGGGARNLSVQAGPGKWRPLLPFAPSCPLPKFTRKFFSRGGWGCRGPSAGAEAAQPQGPWPGG